MVSDLLEEFTDRLQQVFYKLNVQEFEICRLSVKSFLAMLFIELYRMEHKARRVC